MNKRIVGIGVAAAVALGVTAVALHWPGKPDGAVAQAPEQQGPRAVSVEVGTAARKRTPVLLEGLGTVTTIASVAVKTRIDNEIVGIHFQDGAKVEKGDLLVTLDMDLDLLDLRLERAGIERDQQVEGNIARDQAQLEGAERDTRRYTELVAKNATPIVNLDNAKTQSDMFRAAMKVGNFVRSADLIPIAVINQIAPLYVTFTVPQKNLPDVRQAIAAETANVEVLIPGESRHATGVVTMIENTIDPSTGMATLRATMPNTDELLWPGTLITAQMTLRTEDAVVVPSAAVQVSQTGSFVYVVKDGAAVVQPVKVARTMGNETVLEEGLQGGETVVTDGH